MLIDNSLGFSVLSVYKCPSENILGVRLLLDNSPIFLISIYGPNENDITFYSQLTSLVAENSDVPVIIGGDWNSTYSTGEPSINPDVLYMKSIPSKLRSGWLNELCIELELSDPYRALHPTRRDYTFTPRGTKKNRSRLDFFLISNNILPFVHRCEISSSISTALFDHKSVLLDFTKNKTSSKLFINRTILNNPRTDDVVLAAVADTYLSHAAAVQPPGVLEEVHVFHHGARDPLASQKTEVGNFIKLCKDYNALVERRTTDKNSNLLSLLIAEKDTEINLQRDKIWDVERFSRLKLNCSDDFFFEALASNIKGHVISYQTWVKKVENIEKSTIITKLNRLKADYITNSEAITRLESQLNAIIDAETLLKVRSMKLFSCLNAEKPTPIFLSLARSSNAGTNLSCICKDDGSPYSTPEAKTEGIVSYYENIYCKPLSDLTDYSDSITHFLGHDIVTNPIVSSSMLTDEERISLDQPLTINELDLSMEKCNMRSAPGIDGFSNAFIKKYWHFFRTPLFNYATECFRKRQLTANFRSASIKLIPKKGDSSMLKNWRPISLLSNMYKIISRAINARLNKVVNRICSRAQKGFNSQRYTQECLINVIETIAHCNSEDINGAVVAVDMAKAFDTLSHGFLREVFKFVNIGPVMIDWLSLLGENRTACIILDDGTYSRNFRLDRGRAQGDNISPNTFNFADQVLIFKIELDPMINGIWKNFQIPLSISANENSFFTHESMGETGKNESLADDNTTLMLLEDAGLAALRKNLDDSGKISGLICNFDKTVVMPIGRKFCDPK